MEEKIKPTHGGRREGAGRPSSPNSKKQIALKLDNDLYEVFNAPPFAKDGEGLNRGRYINDAVRAQMKKDGFI